MNFRIGFFTITALLLFLLGSEKAVAQIDPALAASLQQALNSHVQNNSNNGVSACLIMPNGDIWTGVSGLGASNIPITDSTVFHGASTTKTNIATLLMLMDESGEIDLDSTWDSYVNLDVEFDTTITVRQLISNTSGIADYLEAAGAGSIVTSDFSYAFTPTEILEDLVSPTPDFAPGTNFQYSSSNFTLAALIAETVAGNPVQQELRSRIWNPLSMNHTYFGGFEPYSEPRAGVWWNFGSGVQNYSSEDETSMLTFGYGGGNIVSTPTDLAHFIRTLMNSSLVDANSLSEMQVFSPESYSSWTAGYGQGIHNASNFGINSVLGHDGYYTNMTDMFHSLDHGFTLVTMTNTQTGWYAIFDDLYPIIEAHLTTHVPTGNKANGFKMFPNPTSSDFKMEINKAQNSWVEIKNGLGSVVISGEVRGYGLLNSSGLPKGIYTVTVQTLERIEHQTLVID